MGQYWTLVNSDAIGEDERTHEEIVCIRIRAADAEELHEIVKLAMNITAHCYGAFLRFNEVSRGSITAIGQPLDPSIPPAARSTLLVTPLLPEILNCQHASVYHHHSHHKKRLHTLSQSRWTSLSGNCLHPIKHSIHPSSVGMDCESRPMARPCGSGDRPESISMLLSIQAGPGDWYRVGWRWVGLKRAEVGGGERLDEARLSDGLKK